MTGDPLLIVDSEPASAGALRDLLSSLEFEVDVVANGEEALDRMHLGPISLLVADRVLPGIDGQALMRLARDLQPGLPTLLLASKAHADTLSRHPQLEVSQVLDKPISPESLRAAVRNLLALKETKATLPSHWIEAGSGHPSIIFKSEPMRQVMRSIEKARHSKAPVLIRGESGPTVTVAVAGQSAARRLMIHVVDARSPIQKVEYSVGGGPWLLLYPADGLADAPDERYELALPAGAEPAEVVIRATDLLQNTTAQSPAVTGP
jgi:DNA-binding NtrC family response regulator